MKSADRRLGIPSAALAVLGILCITAQAAAQRLPVKPPPEIRHAGPPVRVTPQRDLAFGNVIPGLETSIPYSDPTSGSWEVKCENNSFIRIDFLGLPATLAGAGDSMPVRFEATSAYVYLPRAPVENFVFDPTVGITVQAGPPGRAYIYLGGIASPRPNQSPGDYASPVTIDVTYVTANASF